MYSQPLNRACADYKVLRFVGSGNPLAFGIEHISHQCDRGDAGINCNNRLARSSDDRELINTAAGLLISFAAHVSDVFLGCEALPLDLFERELCVNYALGSL